MLDHLCKIQAICSQNLLLQCKKKYFLSSYKYVWIVVYFFQVSNYQDKVLKLYSKK